MYKQLRCCHQLDGTAFAQASIATVTITPEPRALRESSCISDATPVLTNHCRSRIVERTNHYDYTGNVTQTRIIKKYANRRLYDTEASKHVTLSTIRQMIVDGMDIQIIEDTSGEDITRPLLLQIIVEQEQAGGQPILTELLLSQLIRFYGNPMQGMMAEYLQKSVSTFVNQQRTVQSQMQDMMSTTPLDTMRELMTQNMKTWETLLGATTAKNKPSDDSDN